MPVSFTITAIDPETGAVATEFTGTVYVYRYSKRVRGRTEFDGEETSEGEAEGDSIAIEFTAEDRGVKWVQDGLVLTERGETVLAASTEAPHTTFIDDWEIREYDDPTVVIIRYEILELTDAPSTSGAHTVTASRSSRPV